MTASATEPAPPPAPAPETAPDGPSAADFATVAAVAAVSGFLLGVRSGCWQQAVETAQVLAGVIEYPADNPFRAYHVKLWTLCTQLPAVLLWAGVPEDAASLLVSGVMGLLPLTGLALWTLALSGNRLLAAAVPLLAAAAGPPPGSPVYPTQIMGEPFTFGIIGPGYALLVLGVLGCGRRRTASLLAGLAPAVHAPVGAWCFGVTVLALAAEPGRLVANLRSCGPALAAGVLIAAVSLGLQRTLAGDLPRPPADEQARCLEAFLAHWDGHRRPVDLTHPAVSLTATIAAAAAFAWVRPMPGMTAGGNLLVRAAAISAGLALLLCAVGAFPEHLPRVVAVLMPGRFTILTALAMPALALGLIGRALASAGAGPVAAAGAIVLIGIAAFGLHFGRVPEWAVAAAALAVAPLSGIGFRPNHSDTSSCSCGRPSPSPLVGGVIDPRVPEGRARGAHASRHSFPLTPDPSATRGEGGDSAHDDRRCSKSSGLTSRCGLRPAVFALAVAMGLNLLPGAAWFAPAVVVIVAATAWWNRRHPAGAGSVAELTVGAASAVVAAWPTLWLTAAAAALSAAVLLAAPGLIGGPRPARWSAAVVLAAAAGAGVVRLSAEWSAGLGRLREPADSPACAAARGRPGLLLAGPDLGLTQLLCGRPILLDGALNQLPYVPESGPAMSRILPAVYGVDLLDPPAEIRTGRFVTLHPGLLASPLVRPVWERRPRDEWVRLAGEWGFTDVITAPDWTLDLPVAGRSPDHVLYRIPDVAGSGGEDTP